MAEHGLDAIDVGRTQPRREDSLPAFVAIAELHRRRVDRARQPPAPQSEREIARTAHGIAPREKRLERRVFPRIRRGGQRLPAELLPERDAKVNRPIEIENDVLRVLRHQLRNRLHQRRTPPMHHITLHRPKSSPRHHLVHSRASPDPRSRASCHHPPHLTTTISSASSVCDGREREGRWHRRAQTPPRFALRNCARQCHRPSRSRSSRIDAAGIPSPKCRVAETRPRSHNSTGLGQPSTQTIPARSSDVRASRLRDEATHSIERLLQRANRALVVGCVGGACGWGSRSRAREYPQAEGRGLFEQTTPNPPAPTPARRHARG